MSAEVSTTGAIAPLTSFGVNDVRKSFMDFFCSKYNHIFVPSSSSVPHNDPTLLFANSGMNQFKPIFTGDVPPNSEMSNWRRVCNSQKCIRAGGKHNDLEDVGKDTYHHTFFEMLGNWSFADFFKKEIIAWSWELLTEVWGLEKDRLYATYFEGDQSQGLEPDFEARDLWLQYLPESHVLPGNAKDNFWEMGDVGPCGPCSELHYDRIGNRSVPEKVNQDDPNVLEIWNLVFMQYERTADGLKRLANSHVDTGMGLERVVSALQNKPSNYDTDVFTPIFEEIQRITGCRDYTGKVGEEDVDHVDMAYRVVADHIRTLTFALSDGAVPGSLGRGYVLRRILRRAVRYGQEVLGAKPGFLSSLVPCVVNHMGDAFPELRSDPEDVMEIIAVEEKQFGRTLEKGLGLFKRAAEPLPKGSDFPGEMAFKLYDTFGFPVDLTELMCEEQGLKLNQDDFAKAMEEQRMRSRGAGGEGDGVVDLKLDTQAVDFLKSSGIPSTDDQAKYQTDDVAAKVLAIFSDSKREYVDSAEVGDLVGVVLDKTNFYAEQGGQIFDTGIIVCSRDSKAICRVEVENTQLYSCYVVHIGRVVGGVLCKGLDASPELDTGRRLPIMMHHTATHMVNYGLRQVLGDGVQQKGSLVVQEKLRFDFSTKKAMNLEQVTAVEEHVRRQIREKLPIYGQVVPLAKAESIRGLQKVFGERYPDPVRVISVGVPVDELLANPDNEKWESYSIEFCGGTHLGNAAEAEAFALVADDQVAGGVRRIVGLCGEYAREAIAKGRMMTQRVEAAKTLEGQQLVEEVARLNNDIDSTVFSLSVKYTLRQEMDKLVEKVKAFKKERKAKQAALSTQIAETIGSEAGEEAELVVREVDLGADAKVLSGCLRSITKACPKACVFLLSEEDGKTGFFAASPKGSKLSAGDWVKHVCGKFGGKGGGKAESAQGFALDVNKTAALGEAKLFAEGKLH